MFVAGRPERAQMENRTLVGRSAVLALVLAWASYSSPATTKLYSTAELSRWKLVGIGRVTIDRTEKALLLSEGKDSKGITLVSPRSYKNNVSLRFKVKPLRFQAVCVVLLSISDLKTAGPARLPEKHDGNLTLFTAGNVQCYVAAFHSGFHQPDSYIKRYPGDHPIAASPDVATGQEWYEIEFGRRGPSLWLKVNGRTVCQGTDRNERDLPRGSIGFRLRGPGDGTASYLLRDLTVIEE
jgi:hypothetical protein